MTDEKSDGWKLRDFRVRKCPSGGFVVMEDYRDVGMASSPLAAFSNAKDLLAWLQEQFMPLRTLAPAERLKALMEDRVPGQAYPCPLP